MSRPVSSAPSTALWTLTIDRLGGLGDGIGMVAGQTVCVAKTVAGDVVQAAPIHSAKGVMFARLQQVMSAGPTRQTAPCPHFDACGGCSLQQLESDTYQAFKRARVAEALQRAGYSEAEAAMHWLPAASRRRAELKLWHDGAQWQAGYLQQQSHQPVAITQCLILTPALQALYAELRPWLSALPAHLSLTTMTLVEGDQGAQAMLHSRKPVAVSHPRVHCVSGKPEQPFLQASAEGEQLLNDFVLRACAGAQKAIDLFCGQGGYSLSLAKSGVSVTGYDYTRTSIETANQTALDSELLAHFERRDLAQSPLPARDFRNADAVILNPPRAGALKQTEAVAAARVPRVVMISCNPATFGRDAALLKAAGYQLDAACGIDQFVYSPHVEIAASFLHPDAR